MLSNFLHTYNLNLVKAAKMSSIQHKNYSFDEIAVDNFWEYLRIPSEQPNVNYGEYQQ